MPSIVAVTESEYRKAEPIFTSSRRFKCVSVPSDEAGLVRAIADLSADHAVVGHLRYEAALYSALKPGRVLARFGVGHDGIDKAKATVAGILCTNTPGTLDASVAELAMLLIAAAARHLPELASRMAAGSWAPRVGTELKGKRLVIIGSGRIGTALARIATHGFGMRVTGYVRSGAATTPSDPYEQRSSDFAACVKGADFVSLHIGASPENLRFVNRERLALLDPRAWLINTARGAVVDEVALFDALSSGQLAGAAPRRVRSRTLRAGRRCTRPAAAAQCHHDPARRQQHTGCEPPDGRGGAAEHRARRRRRLRGDGAPQPGSSPLARG